MSSAKLPSPMTEQSSLLNKLSTFYEIRLCLQLDSVSNEIWEKLKFEFELLAPESPRNRGKIRIPFQRDLAKVISWCFFNPILVFSGYDFGRISKNRYRGIYFIAPSCSDKLRVNCLKVRGCRVGSLSSESSWKRAYAFNLAMKSKSNNHFPVTVPRKCWGPWL